MCSAYIHTNHMIYRAHHGFVCCFSSSSFFSLASLLLMSMFTHECCYFVYSINIKCISVCSFSATVVRTGFDVVSEVWHADKQNFYDHVECCVSYEHDKKKTTLKLISITEPSKLSVSLKLICLYEHQHSGRKFTCSGDRR